MNTKFTVVIFLVLLLASCERVIDINLNDANPQIVIEATINNNDALPQVKITSTGNFFSPYTANPVSGAKITLSSKTKEYTYKENNEGNYVFQMSDSFNPALYKLSVAYNGETFDAESQMPDIIAINHLAFEYKGKSFYYEAGYVVSFVLIDPEDQENYYRVRYFLNGELQNEADDFMLYSDKLFNGKAVQMELNGTRFELNDRITIELMSINESTYEYFNTLSSIVTQNNIESAAPDNPKSNFSNGALGYFAAYSSDIKTVIIENSK